MVGVVSSEVESSSGEALRGWSKLEGPRAGGGNQRLILLLLQERGEGVRVCGRGNSQGEKHFFIIQKAIQSSTSGHGYNDL